MDRQITHACGHEQSHLLSGYASQQERKAAWLRTTPCRTCFITAKRAHEAEAAIRASAALAHLNLPLLCGSDRQIAWATTIRERRLAALSTGDGPGDRERHGVLHAITDAKWWIDGHDLSDTDLCLKALSPALTR